MPSAAEVHVWWARVDQLTGAHHDLLDTGERERSARLRHDDDRDRLVLGAVLARSLVAALDGTDAADVALDRTCPRCGQQHGPVTAPGRDWHVSVTHSGAFALAAVVGSTEATMLGVDLETRCPPEWGALVADLLAPGEPAPTDEAAFVAMWVRKEAVLKATREGLTRRMSTVDVGGAAGPARLRDDLAGLLVIDLDVEPLLVAGAPGPSAATLAVGAGSAVVRWARAVL